MTFGEGLARKSKFLARNNKRRLRCISATPAGNRVLRTRAAIALPLTGEEAPPHFGRLFGRRPRREGVPPCSKEGANMRFFIAVGLLALSASPSLAQNCNIIGNSTFCDNGLSANRIGNSTFFSDGTSANRIGNSTFFSDGTSAQTASATRRFTATGRAQTKLAIRPSSVTVVAVIGLATRSFAISRVPR